MAEDAQYFDVPDELLQPESHPLDRFVVDHRAWRAWSIFLECQNQWHWLSDGKESSIHHMDLAAVIAVIKLHTQSRKRRLLLLNQIQAVEAGAIARRKTLSLDKVLDGR